MKKKNFLLEMLVLALIFGMTIVGCDNDTTNTPQNYDISGTENPEMKTIAGIFYNDKATNGIGGTQYKLSTSYDDAKNTLISSYGSSYHQASSGFVTAISYSPTNGLVIIESTPFSFRLLEYNNSTWSGIGWGMN